MIDDSFEIVPAAGGGTAPLIGALERLLARAQGDRPHVVIVGRPGKDASHYYVQFMVHPDGRVYAEATSNDYIDAQPASLDSMQHASLLELGWHASEDPEHPAGPRPCNYWRGWEAPAPLRAAATLAIVSLFAAYGLDWSEPLAVRVFPGVQSVEHDPGAERAGASDP